MEKVLFREVQKHNQWWHKLIMIVSILSLIIPISYGIYSQELLDKPFGKNPMSTEALIILGLSSLLILGILLIVFFMSSLKIRITNDCIYYSYPSLSKKEKKLMPEEIESFEMRTFKPIKEYGGYGIKKKRKNDIAYIVSGNTGIQFYLKNGNKLLIGTQRKQAVYAALRKLMNDNINSL